MFRTFQLYFVTILLTASCLLALVAMIYWPVKHFDLKTGQLSSKVIEWTMIKLQPSHPVLPDAEKHITEDIDIQGRNQHLAIFADVQKDPWKVILERDFSSTPPNCSMCTEGIFLNDSNPSNKPLPSIDDGWLRFTIRSNTSAGAGGSYFVKFRDDEVMPGESLYVRWQQRFDAPFLEASKAGGGVKIAIFGDADQYSCSSNEIVLVDVYSRGMVQGYHACGYSEPFQVPNPPYDFNYQPGGDNACWRSTKTFPDEPGGCYRFVADELFTFEIRIDVAANINENSRIRLWVTRESRGRERVIDYLRVLKDSTKGYGAVWLLPYNTGKRPTFSHPEAHTWYDNLLVAKMPAKPSSR